MNKIKFESMYFKIKIVTYTGTDLLVVAQDI
jgi:hypothetical protein